MRRGGGQHHGRKQGNNAPPAAAAKGSPTFESLADEAFQLTERAERRRDEQAAELLGQSVALYQQALALNPQHLDTRYNLAHAMYSRAKATKSSDLARNLLAQAAEQFTVVFHADQSRLPALYNAASVYILLGDRLEVPAQQFQAYNSACTAFATLFPLLTPPDVTAPLPEGAKVVSLPETREERIEREVMEALLQSETVHATDVLTHWGEALTKKAGIEPNLATAQTYYAQACGFHLRIHGHRFASIVVREAYDKLLQLLPNDPECPASYASAFIAEAQRFIDSNSPAGVARANELLHAANAVLLPHTMASILSPPLQALQEAAQYYSLSLAKLRMSSLSSPEDLGEMLAKLGDVSLDAHKASGVAGDSAVLLDALRYYEESLRVLMPLGYSELAPIVYNFACALALGGRAPLCEQQLRWLAVHSPSELGDAATDSDFDRVKGEEWFLHLMRARR